ncbi:LysM peptidoglycan-binding domain-containing protein [Paenibacillus sp. FA6]|uniref:LysM peptidoglycan-binding domain-containing protein n=1 Tax=Paenibacillus sp. FA6 TaxID=3413029 RepID=UPI003F654B04
MKIHMVKKGDTLYNLSGKYGIPLEKLIEANPQLLDPNKLNIGDKVKIPSKSVSTSKPEDAVHKHVVKQGDSLWKISKAWGVTLKEMLDANSHLKNPNALLVGEVVNIPEVVMKEGVYNASSEGKGTMDKITHGGKTNTGVKTETAPNQALPPVVPQLPPLPVNPAPIIQAPNPVFESHEEKVEMSQHLFIQFPVPAQEVVAQQPVVEPTQKCPVSAEKTTYPGVTEGYSYSQPQYEQQGYGYGQSSYPEMMQMTHQMPEYCNPNISPYNAQFMENTSGYSSYGAYTENAPATVSNATLASENAPVIHSDIYSCTHPFEWTFPQSNMQGGYSAMPNMSYGAYGSAYPQQTEVKATQDCGCQSREQDGSPIESDVLVSDKELETAQTSSVSKGRKGSGNQIGKSAPKKEVKKSSVQHRRRNPWIKN